MPKTVKIPLSTPIEGHRTVHTEIVLREPVWDDVMGTGAPYTIHRDKEERPFLVYDEAVIAHYVERCIVEPAHFNLLANASLGDAMAVREAIIGFFLHATVGAGGGSTTSPTSSGSNAG